jgi:23S rRNA (cytosine1962-C5)-methyltransferase
MRSVLRLLPAHAARVSRAVALGHPWIYDRAVGATPLPPGAIVEVRGDAPLGCGFVDPASPIRVRMLARDPGQAIDDGFCRARAAAAAGRRRGQPALAATDAVRAIHGENDALPGLTIDVYAGTAVVVFDGAAAASVWRPRLPAILAGLGDGGLPIAATWVRGVRGARGGDPGDGGDGGPTVAMVEHGARFTVDVRAGQKTGFFLDQRGNRARIAALASGARVLNLFAYTGGFSIAAGRAGAVAVTSVDIAPQAIAAADRHWRDNGLAAGAHRAVAADCFDFLATAAARGERWDIVVVDPPSFAASEAARPAGLAAYQRLNRAALAVTAPAGLLVAASCSSHVSEPDLRGVLAEVGLAAGRALVVVEARGHDPDHPTLPAFPEGQYLKLLIAAAGREIPRARERGRDHSPRPANHRRR